ncbi:MAG: NAD(P)H-hydrate dehydratase [Prolixibacteraceae bacterium]
MKLFKTSQITEIDQYTIANEPIADIDLMERAALTVVNYLVNETDASGELMVFCGPGNNGGDGLAVARLLADVENRFSVKVFFLHFNRDLKGSPAINLDRLKNQNLVEVCFLTDENDLPPINSDSLIIDALFGSGLNRPLEGFPAKVIHHLNQSGAVLLSIDIPSGLMGEDNTKNIDGNIIRAHKTITFQFPKLSFLFPENECYVGDWEVTNIGLHPDVLRNTPTSYFFTTNIEAKKLIKTRTKFSHKGTFGHALLIAGTYGKMGAAVLASRACLRSGVGLLTTHIPHSALSILQTAVPEAMTSIDDSDLMFTAIEQTKNYSAIAIGPGIGTKVNTKRGLKVLLQNHNDPMILDADALNILGENKDWLELLPHHSILTPHPKEFERIAGVSINGYQRMQLAINFAQQYKVILVVKGANTMVINPLGEVWFNSTGNPGMASAGSGDALSGILLGLLAQGYPPFDAARLGVYVHGLAGDIAAARRGYESLIASDLIENMGEAFKLLHK